MKALDNFTRAYIEAALWSTMDESNEKGGEPLGKNYGPEDLAPECLETIEADCKAFQESFGDVIDLGKAGEDYSTRERAGHDFWLTRNGHGCGFWDGDWPMSMPADHPAATKYKDIGAFLTAMSNPCGEVNLYVGDDGRIHC